NVLLDTKQQRAELAARRKAEGATAAIIRCECEAQIWGPARRFKESLGTGQPVGMSEQEDKIIGLLHPVFNCYSDGYQFQMNSIYYDVKANPLQHLKAFVCLNAILAKQDKKCTQALPLRRSWVYSHVPLNTAILARCILGQPYKRLLGGKDNIQPNIDKYWAQAVDLKRRMFRPHVRHLFKGVIYTDGVSISAVRETVEVKPTKSKAGRKRKRVESEQQPWQPQPVAQRARLAYHPVQLPQYQQAQQSWILAVQQVWKSADQAWQAWRSVEQVWQVWIPAVQQAWQAWRLAERARLSAEQEWQAWIPAEQVWQAWLSAQPVQALVQQPLLQTSPVQLQQQADCAYISDLSQAQLQSTVGCCVLVDPGRQDLLFMMHEKSTVQEKCVYRHTCSQQRKETRVTKYRKILQNEKTADVAAAERRLGAGSCIKPNLKLFEEYLAARAEVAADLTRHYNETMCNQQDGATTPKVPLHRKLRLSAYINHQRADQLLINRLKKRFSQDAIFILGNWSASMTRFHEPIRGKGWRTLLKRGGFDVYLIDEYLTSKTCPNCN
ncbi:hypothetical protein GGF45_003424, partial [Coemansia sp. RSA 551]